jgi:hypothetical protein
MALCSLVEDTKFRIPIFGRGLLSYRNQTNHVSVWFPLDIIAWTDLVQVRDGFRESDLIFACSLAISLRLQ